MISVIDYGMGNSGSILNMLRKIGVQAELTNEPARIAVAEKLILPGVGAFDKGMEQLHRLQLVGLLNERVLEKHVPVLGICLGMQLFTKRSAEGSAPGLGWVDAECKKFDVGQTNGLRVPQMGWNTLRATRSHFLTDSLEEDARFYFVHSFFVECAEAGDVLTRTVYGEEFTSSLAHGSIMGVQFHPEKSLRWGMSLMRRFSEHA